MKSGMFDKITECIPDTKITAVKGLAMSEDVFDYHFPNHPVYPGVLMIQGFSELASEFIKASSLEWDDVRLQKVAKFHYKQMAVPGDMLELELQKKDIGEDTIKFSAVVRVENTLVAQIKTMTFARHESVSKQDNP